MIPEDRIITRKEAARMTRISEDEQYRRPDFPKAIKLGKGYNGRVGLLVSELQAWIRARVDERNRDLQRTKPFA